MGQISIAITKRMAFRDSVQHFANVYTYRSIDSNPIFGTAGQLIDEVVTKERAFHGGNVFFVKGAIWSSGGTILENKMIEQKALTGTGSLPERPGMDRERAYLVMWSAGKDRRNKPVYLRKWYHTCADIVGAGTSGAILEGLTGFTQANRDALVAAFKGVTRIGSASEWGMTADSGRERDGGDPTVHRYLEHHQLGDEWRQ